MKTGEKRRKQEIAFDKLKNMKKSVDLPVRLW